MKKIIVSLVAVLIVAASYANGGEEKVAPEVLTSFRHDFAKAENVNWTEGENFYKAEFTFSQNRVFAYYGKDGELMGLTRNIRSTQLSSYLQKSLKKKYSNYWISELFVVTNCKEASYYVTLENVDTKLTLVSSNGGSWSVFEKNNKE